MPISKQVHWPSLITSGIGIFIGSFWVFLGFLLMLGQSATWWQYLVTLLPGGGIVFLVLMARRYPFPYGIGLMLMGAIPMLMFHLSSAWRLRLGFGAPLLVIGLLFVLWRKHGQSENVADLHG